MRINVLLFIFFALLLFFTSCFEKEKTYYPNGNIKEEYETKNDIPNGYIKRYYPNGELNILAYYKDGKLNGKLIRYDSIGNKVAEENYLNDKKNGLAFYYYLNGQVESKFNYLNGQLYGQSLGYYKNGALSFKSQYVHNMKQGLSLGYYENGTLSSKGKYAYGKKEGIFYYYHPNSKLKQVEEYKNGVLLCIKNFNKNGNFVYAIFNAFVQTESDSITLGDTIRAKISLYKSDSFSNMIIRVGFATIEEYREFKKPKGNPPIVRMPYYIKEPFNGIREVELIPDKKGKFILHGGISFTYKGDKSYFSDYYKEIIVY